MDKIERIHSLMEELEEAVQDAFSEFTRASVTVDRDGYRWINVEKWAKDDGVLPVEARKRRELFDQSRIGGDWTADRSVRQNEYYRKCRILLEGGKKEVST